MSACDQLRWALKKGATLSQGELAHASVCDDCAELCAADATVARHLLIENERRSARVFVEAPTMLVQLRTDLRRERGVRAFLRSRSTTVRVAIILVAFAGIGFGHATSLLRADAGVYPPLRLALELAGLGLLAFASTALALRPLHRPHARRAVGIAMVAAALLVPVASAFASPAHASHPASLQGVAGDLPARAIGCFVYGLLWSLPVILLFAFADRSPSKSSVLLAAGASTLTANLALWLHCPITRSLHVLLGHATIGIALVATGAIFTRLQQTKDGAVG